MVFVMICKIRFFLFVFVLSCIAFLQANADEVCPANANSASYRECLTNSESSNNPLAVNPDLHYVGLYQWGTAQMQQMGMCSQAPTEDSGVQDWSKCDFNGPRAQALGINKLSCCGATLTCADTNCQGAFLSNSASSVAAQEKLKEVWDAQQWADIQRRAKNQGLDLASLCGTTTASGVPITRESLMAAAHLGGGGGAMALLRGEVRNDGNTSTQQYAVCMNVCLTTGMSIQDCKKKGC